MASIEDLKKENENKVAQCFYDGCVWTKNELSQATYISPAKVTSLLQLLLNYKEIQFIGEASSTGGRKAKQYQLNCQYTYFLKIILLKRDDHYTLVGKVVNLFDQQQASYQRVVQEGTLDDVVSFIEMIMTQHQKISVMILSIPGVCYQGIVEICDYYKLQGVALLDVLTQRFHLKVLIENDVNVACVGLSYDYPKVQHLAFVYQPQSDYIGVGMMIFRQLYNGYSHFAGELRYLPFYSHQEQLSLLKDNPSLLLQRQVETLIATMNPEVIGICSDVLSLESFHSSYIPTHHQPQYVIIDDLKIYIEKGLFHIGIHYLKESRGQNND